MQKNDPCYSAFVAILHDQLRPAMGCTEPIAIAYCGAVARRALGCVPERVIIRASGNIIKNAKSVTVPNTNGRKGIEAACAAGIVGGNADKELEVISELTPAHLRQLDDFIGGTDIQVCLQDDGHIFDILVELYGQGHTSRVRIVDRHTNIVWVERDGEVVQHGGASAGQADQSAGASADEALLSIEAIYDFAATCDLADVREPIARQIALNTAIAREGLRGDWGANVGKTILDMCGEEDVRMCACAMAAAGSDARMGGCDMPVVINSGSGNQGITASMPVICYAQRLGAGEERLYRALVLSNLTAIHQKSEIGCLSAYCGVVTAGCAAGAGVAYLNGADLYTVEHTIVNSLAILSGTICDGAKPSCAAKIASAVYAALLSYHMALSRRQFRDGEGIVKKGVENTIHNVGRLAKDGMCSTDQEILRMMTGE